jgi:hypothetical protein
MKIYKYPVRNQQGQDILNIPYPVKKVLGVYLDPQEIPCLYAVVDDEHPLARGEKVFVHCYWTGADLPALITYFRYLNTLTINGLVFHYFTHEEVIGL